MSAPKQVKLGAKFCDEYYKAIAVAKKHNLALEVMKLVADKTRAIEGRVLKSSELIPACECVFSVLREIADLDNLDSINAESYEGAQSQRRTKAARARKRDVLIKEIRSLAKKITGASEPITARNARYVARMKELMKNGLTDRLASSEVNKEETEAGLTPPTAERIRRIFHE